VIDYEAEVKKIYPNAHIQNNTWTSKPFFDCNVMTGPDEYKSLGLCRVHEKTAWKTAYEEIQSEILKRLSK
jgi:hypothetical protein